MPDPQWQWMNQKGPQRNEAPWAFPVFVGGSDLLPRFFQPHRQSTNKAAHDAGIRRGKVLP